MSGPPGLFTGEGLPAIKNIQEYIYNRIIFCGSLNTKVSIQNLIICMKHIYGKLNKSGEFSKPSMIYHWYKPDTTKYNKVQCNSALQHATPEICVLQIKPVFYFHLHSTHVVGLNYVMLPNMSKPLHIMLDLKVSFFREFGLFKYW